jgi:hypothetical protein
VTAADETHGIRHGDDVRTEGERDSDEADADSGNFAASTALPQPPNTSQNVPNNSAAERLRMGM